MMEQKRKIYCTVLLSFLKRFHSPTVLKPSNFTHTPTGKVRGVENGLATVGGRFKNERNTVFQNHDEN